MKDDEHRLELTIEHMMGMCGNEGQRTLISRNSDAFWEWGMAALENEGEFGGFEDMLDALDVSWDDHSLPGTIEIWNFGYEKLVAQSAFHDSMDEQGEGQGDNVSGSGDGFN